MVAKPKLNAAKKALQPTSSGDGPAQDPVWLEEAELDELEMFLKCDQSETGEPGKRARYDPKPGTAVTATEKKPLRQAQKNWRKAPADHVKKDCWSGPQFCHRS